MRVAVIGLGSAGARHARNLLDLGHEVIGFDPVVAQSSELSHVESVEEAIDEAEAVVVASPSSFHAAQALAALVRKRPVLIEKPLATTVEDAEAVVDAARQGGIAAAVAMNLRFHPGLVELKRLIDEGALGRVRLVQASFGYDLRLWRPQSDYRTSYSARQELGGGIIFDAIHELDYLLWLLGPAASVSAQMGHVSELELDVEDAAVAAIQFTSGALGAVDINFFEPAYRRGCVLVGTEAVARWEWNSGSVSVSRDGVPDVVVPFQTDAAPTYRAVVENFLAAADGSEEPRTPLAEGLEAVRLADALKRAAVTGRRMSVGEAS